MLHVLVVGVLRDVVLKRMETWDELDGWGARLAGCVPGCGWLAGRHGHP